MTAATVAGHAVRLPVVVRDATAASATFVVPAGPVAPWLPDGLALARPAPGRALLVLTAVRYRRNDLGAYDELAVSLAVRERGTLRTGIWVRRMPVDDAFSRDAGLGIWGFPKSVEDLDVTTADGRTTCTWAGVLCLEVDHRGAGRLPAVAQRAYTGAPGAPPRRTRFVTRAAGFGVRPGGARLELGAGEAADELRSLGLPARAVWSLSMNVLQAKFDAPETLAAG